VNVVKDNKKAKGSQLKTLAEVMKRTCTRK